MIVQEAGMAVGWPLGLGHDTTGWPLGLRLRLTQEDLQWPREPHLDDSPSYSTNSSSLDTESTRSFFQDKSISLGTLIGLPINHYPAANNNNNQHQQSQRRARNSNSMLRVFPTSTSSGSRCGSDHHHHGHKPRSSHGSNRPQLSKGAASAGWTLLSVLSCARVPSGTNSTDAGGAAASAAATGGSRSSKSSSSSSRSRSSELSTSNPPAAAAAAENARQGAGGAAAQFASRSPPANKLYDNITFEEEAADHDDSHSSEWNPLFASSSLENVEDEDDLDLDGASDAVPESLQHMQSLMRSHSSYSDSTQASDWSSASESFDKRNSKSSSHADARHDLSSQFGKHSALHMLISRMVCCRSTPTVDT
ncbi:hypothetical protein Mapa_005863 [Marchantia paleacea]|nr:hypothetical protein Mapa_005863 [Marchantia paleacea]